MKAYKLRNLVVAAMFMSLGIVLPFFTAQLKEIGDTLLPMHIPVMFCGLVCGPWYGLAVGVVVPLLRGALFSMPPLYPNGVWMALELATYGGMIGLIYCVFPKKNTGAVYLSLITAMISGRIVWGVAKTVLLGLSDKVFSFQAFLTGGFLDAIPGIVLQLILIPGIMEILNRTKLK